MNLILNILWMLTGGLWLSLGWMLAACLMALSIIGLPWVRSAMVMAAYSLMPFGLQARVRADVPSPETGMGILVNAGNILWLVLAGWWLALGHLIAAVLNAVTIIGLPFAWAHLKLAGFALQPVGRTLVAR